MLELYKYIYIAVTDSQFFTVTVISRKKIKINEHLLETILLRLKVPKVPSINVSDLIRSCIINHERGDLGKSGLLKRPNKLVKGNTTRRRILGICFSRNLLNPCSDHGRIKTFSCLSSRVLRDHKSSIPIPKKSWCFILIAKAKTCIGLYSLSRSIPQLVFFFVTFQYQ